MWPTTSVRDSYLEGERVDVLAGSTSATRLDLAASDFDAYVDQQRGVQFGWGVPITRFWYVEGTTYIGTLVIRHRLPPELARVGGHVGYHVVAPCGARATQRGCSLRASPSAVGSGWNECC